MTYLRYEYPHASHLILTAPPTPPCSCGFLQPKPSIPKGGRCCRLWPRLRLLLCVGLFLWQNGSLAFAVSTVLAC